MFSIVLFLPLNAVNIARFGRMNPSIRGLSVVRTMLANEACLPSVNTGVLCNSAGICFCAVLLLFTDARVLWPIRRLNN